MKSFFVLSAAALITAVSGVPTTPITTVVHGAFPWTKPIVQGDSAVGSFGAEIKASDKVIVVNEDASKEARSLQKRDVSFEIWQGKQESIHQ